jgi:hypothetical protein
MAVGLVSFLSGFILLARGLMRRQHGRVFVGLALLAAAAYLYFFGPIR